MRENRNGLGCHSGSGASATRRRSCVLAGLYDLLPLNAGEGDGWELGFKEHTGARKIFSNGVSPVYYPIWLTRLLSISNPSWCETMASWSAPRRHLQSDWVCPSRACTVAPGAFRGILLHIFHPIQAGGKPTPHQRHSLTQASMSEVLTGWGENGGFWACTCSFKSTLEWICFVDFLLTSLISGKFNISL